MIKIPVGSKEAPRFVVEKDDLLADVQQLVEQLCRGNSGGIAARFEFPKRGGVMIFDLWCVGGTFDLRQCAEPINLSSPRYFQNVGVTNGNAEQVASFLMKMVR